MEQTEQTERAERFRASPGGGTGGISITPVPPRSPASPRPTRQALERLAVEAHHRGDTWNQFWPGVAAEVSQAEPWDNAAYRRLVNRLSHLLTCGDTGGMLPIDTGWERPAAWELDDLRTEFDTAFTVGADTQAAREQGPNAHPYPGGKGPTGPFDGDRTLAKSAKYYIHKVTTLATLTEPD